MINIQNDKFRKKKISELLKKQYAFIEKEKGFTLKTESDEYFYSGVDYVRDEDELVISIGYDLRENYLSERMWVMLPNKNWKHQNDNNGTGLEFFLHKYNRTSEFPQLPPLKELNRQSLEKVIKERSRLFKENFDSLIKELLKVETKL